MAKILLSISVLIKTDFIISVNMDIIAKETRKRKWVNIHSVKKTAFQRSFALRCSSERYPTRNRTWSAAVSSRCSGNRNGMDSGAEL